MKNRKKVIYLTLVLATSLLITGCGKKAELKDNNTAVSLKSGKITANDYYEELKKDADSIEKLVNMIDHKLLDKKYPSDSEEESSINSQIENIKSYYKDDEATYLSTIKSYFGVNSEDELRKVLSLEYKRNKAVKDYIEKNLTDAEINKYYEENIYGDIKASHILISIDAKEDASDDEKEKAKEKALKKAKKVIKELDEGKKFSDLAKKYSDDDATKSKGGDLGYFNKDDMDGSFWNAALELKKDEYTKEPVESSYGYHIILKTGEKEKKTLKGVKSSIKETLTSDKLSNDKALYYKTLMSIREDKKVTFKDNDLEKKYNNYMNDLIDKANGTTQE